jgi:cell division septum initiation protein DivIVA
MENNFWMLVFIMNYKKLYQENRKLEAENQSLKKELEKCKKK